MIYSVCKCDMRPSVRYLMRGKGKGLKRDCKALLQSVKFKCWIWSEITKNFSK